MRSRLSRDIYHGYLRSLIYALFLNTLTFVSQVPHPKSTFFLSVLLLADQNASRPLRNTQQPKQHARPRPQTPPPHNSPERTLPLSSPPTILLLFRRRRHRHAYDFHGHARQSSRLRNSPTQNIRDFQIASAQQYVPRSSGQGPTSPQTGVTIGHKE